MYCHLLRKVHTRTYWYVLLVICLYQYVQVCTGMYCNAKIYQKYIPVHTPQEYKSVHTGTYQYVLVHTAIHQVYRIPDVDQVSLVAATNVLLSNALLALRVLAGQQVAGGPAERRQGKSSCTLYVLRHTSMYKYVPSQSGQ